MSGLALHISRLYVIGCAPNRQTGVFSALASLFPIYLLSLYSSLHGILGVSIKGQRGQTLDTFPRMLFLGFGDFLSQKWSLSVK